MPTLWSWCDHCWKKNKKNEYCLHLWNESIRYAFQTHAWRQANFTTRVLTKIHRQRDEEWIDILNRVKHGALNYADLDYLEELRRPLPDFHKIKPTHLYTHRTNVDYKNELEFRKLKGMVFEYHAEDRGSLDYKPFTPMQLREQREWPTIP